MHRVSYRNRNNRILNLAPTRIIVFSFAILILTGTLLLSLPIASRDGKSIGLINALFTATSATCVTGLVVVDTYNHWTLFGQIVIMLLIQTGGLGIITLASFFSVLLRRKVSMKGMLLAQESINHFSYEGILNMIKRVVIITFAIELTGALLLSTRFIPIFGPRGIYFSLFHSVSAFCNAGIDLMGALGIGDFVSLTQFNNDPVIIYTIAGLIIIGGLGFIVWKDLYEYRKEKGLLLHTKVVLTVTACLITFGTLFFLAFEFNNPATMGKLDFFGKLNSAFFQSVTPRTAGFNSLPLNDMMEISKVLTIILMFIGAAPGSTAGGIKVTTFSIILIAIISQVKGSEETVIFKHRVPNATVMKALTIAGLSAMLVTAVTTVIMAFENLPLINVLYEVTSAFGTVGLSTGITPELRSISKLMLVMTMFLGRVGPLTFAIALSLKHNNKKADIIYPEGKIVVG
jgi:trk system potassium uptake protein TrkH